MFFFKQKTAYEMRISDWSSDVCSSDFLRHRLAGLVGLDRCISDKWPLRLGAADRSERAVRTEERSVGKECVSSFRSPWAPFHYKKNINSPLTQSSITTLYHPISTETLQTTYSTL